MQRTDVAKDHRLKRAEQQAEVWHCQHNHCGLQVWRKQGVLATTAACAQPQAAACRFEELTKEDMVAQGLPETMADMQRQMYNYIDEFG